MQKTRCLIVDDEPLAIEIIETYLNRLDGFQIIAKCKNALEAFSVMENETIDLIFLDIQMPQLTGVDFVKAMTQKPKVIFTTAYVDYAIESYELNILDYLVKPIPFERFFKAIAKYKSLSQPTEIKGTSPNPTEDSISLRVNKKNHKVFLANIKYVESIKDYVKVHTADKTLIVKTTLTNFEKQLPASSFIRVHRSYIVNQLHVTAHTSKDIEIDEIEIPIGISYKQQVVSTFG